MDALDIMRFLETDIHSVVMATADENGLPITCAADIMDSDENGLYFLTAKGKGFYRRLSQSGYVALTGMKGNDTLSCIAVSVRGKVKELGREPLPRLLEKNPYMYEIYPTELSRRALTVFSVYDGTGEWFDLSKKPIERISFTFGSEKEIGGGYYITDKCVGCGKCRAVCPQSCIDLSALPAVINQQNCLRCGNCMSVCEEKAVIRRGENP